MGLALKTNSLTLLISSAVNDFVENQIRKTPNERKMMNCNMVLILLMNINNINLCGKVNQMLGWRKCKSLSIL
jgi:hypothetical protein